MHLGGGKRQFHQLAGRGKRVLKHFGKGDFRHRQFVVGNRQPALDNMKNPRRGPAVTFGIMQNTLFDAIGIDDVRGKIIPVHGQRQHPRQSRTVQREGPGRQLGRGDFLKIIVEKILNALVGRAEMLTEQAVFFARLRRHGRGDLRKLLVALHRHGGTANEGEFYIDMGNEMRRQINRRALVSGCVHWELNYFSRRTESLPTKCLPRH